MLPPRDIENARERACAAVGQAIGLPAWPPVPIHWNRRLRRAGRALIDGRGRRIPQVEIELSPAYFEVYPEDLYGILVHEAVHVGLALQGRAFGHGPTFRNACLRAGGMLHGRGMPGRLYRYRCPLCGRVLERRRLAALDRWCAACVGEARTRGLDPFRPGRELVLVGTRFGGPERAPTST